MPSVHSVVSTVSASKGSRSFFVRRNCDDDAPKVDRRARFKTLMLISMLMASELDSNWYDSWSNMVSLGFINIVARMNTTAIDTYDWDLRPHLRALVWDDGEADDIVFQAHPAYLAQG